MHLVQLYVGQWQVKVAVCYTANAIIFVTIGLLFINQPNLISFAFISELATVMEQDVSFIQNGLSNILVWITVIVIVVTGIDLVSIWLKTLKPKEIKKAV
jgi:heme/copper-type cytochrome/quinol oxidase subunit 2